MQISTERLDLLVLTARQLKLWTDDTPALEKELNVVYRAEPMTDFFRDIVRGQQSATESDSDHFYWHSFWLLIRRSDRVVVGSADFKDSPSAEGEVEIGYGLGKEFEHCGYMTEAVAAMCRMALEHEGVKHVIAETETADGPSPRILTRCGFKQYKSGESFWWRL